MRDIKKITCFIPTLAAGGAEHQISVLANMLAEKGYDVSIVTYYDAPIHFELHPSIKVIILKVNGPDWLKQLQISKFFLGHKTDCVISYRFKMNFIVLIPMLFRPGLKVIVSERGFTNGKPNFFARANYNLLYYRPNSIVTNSFSQNKYLKSLNKRWAKRVTTIVNYTDLDKFKCESFPQTRPIRIGVFANLNPHKNPERILRVVKRLKDEGNSNFQISWYGTQYDSDGSENKSFLKIKSLIEENQLQDIFHLYPPIKSVSKELQSFHFSCLPSLTEGFSNAISEGISCGRAMLVSAISDNVIMVRDGENGFLFDPTDEESIYQAFVKALSLDNSTIEKMGHKSREIAESLFDKNGFINSYIELIEK